MKLINTSVTSGNWNSATEPKTSDDAVMRFAAEKKIDVSTLEGLSEAERGAKKKWPKLFFPFAS